jgi:prepilin-type N-terminal cleavage/methylation domain-containing protein
MKIKNKNRGFTLIELIIVIGILGILAVAALAVLNPLAQFQKANDTRRKSDLAQIQRALETYYQDHNAYPVVTGTPYQIPTVAWGSSWAPYINTLPKDPNFPSRSYVYYSFSGQSYYLYASLERGSNDPAACNKGLACRSISDNGSPTCGNGAGVVCNYGVSSPDVMP